MKKIYGNSITLKTLNKMVTVNGSTYALKFLSLTETYILEKNGEPVWLIPDELAQDVNIILAYAGAAQKFLEKTPPPNDDQKKVDILSATKPDL